MKHQFVIKGLPGAVFEQEVKVTEIVERSVPVESGDDVLIVCRATVGNVYADGKEVELVNLRPDKITRVLRRKRKK